MLQRYTIYIVLPLLALLVGCNGSSSSRGALHHDGAFTLYSLDGDRYPGEPAPEGAELLHGWLVLKSCPIKSIATREKLFKALDRGIDQYDAEFQVDCFNPRHAIRVESMGTTVDYLICFQCSNYYIWEGEKQVSGGNTTSYPKATFDEVLAGCSGKTTTDDN